MHHFTTSVRVNAPCQSVFEFHTLGANLERITTPDVKIISMKESGDGRGKTISLVMRWRGILKMRWLVALETFDPPHALTDVQVQGPFKFFRHARTFKPISERSTEMADDVTYALPFGFLGTLVEKVIVNRIFKRQFAYRHERTKAILEQEAHPHA